MTLFQVMRLATSTRDTIGALWEMAPGQVSPRQFLAFTLEDPPHEIKVPQHTRIPAGKYELTLRTEGNFHTRYAKRFPKMHEGMIWVRNVPGFEFILIHTGNTSDDTAGCLLVGTGVEAFYKNPSGRLWQSTVAYEHVYPIIRDAIKAGLTFIEYVDLG